MRVPFFGGPLDGQEIEVPEPLPNIFATPEQRPITWDWNPDPTTSVPTRMVEYQLRYARVGYGSTKRYLPEYALRRAA